MANHPADIRRCPINITRLHIVNMAHRPVKRDSMTASTAVQAALNNPSLIKRPIIEGDGILELGFDPARWAEVFKL